MGIELGWPRFDRSDLALLAATTTAAVAYGVLHDQVTAGISPEYFAIGKGLADQELALRWAVALLAVNASWAPGLLLGFVLRLANAPTNALPRLELRHLVRIGVVPFVAAFMGAALLGLSPQSLDPFDQRATALALGSLRTEAFVTVWRIHAGTYAGGLIGLAIAVARVRRARHLVLTRSRA